MFNLKFNIRNHESIIMIWIIIHVHALIQVFTNMTKQIHLYLLIPIKNFHMKL